MHAVRYVFVHNGALGGDDYLRVYRRLSPFPSFGHPARRVFLRAGVLPRAKYLRPDRPQCERLTVGKLLDSRLNYPDRYGFWGPAQDPIGLIPVGITEEDRMLLQRDDFVKHPTMFEVSNTENTSSVCGSFPKARDLSPQLSSTSCERKVVTAPSSFPSPGTVPTNSW